MSNADVDFKAQNLQWRSYITRDARPTTRQVELIGKKEFAATVLDLKYKTFVIHIAALSINPGDKLYPSRRAQIAYLKVDNVRTKVPSEYADFVDVFSPKLAPKLPEHTGIHDHTIELVDN